MSSDSEQGRPEKSELKAEEKEREAALLFHQFCVLQHLDPETSEAAVRYEEWHAARPIP